MDASDLDDGLGPDPELELVALDGGPPSEGVRLLELLLRATSKRAFGQKVGVDARTIGRWVEGTLKPRALLRSVMAVLGIPAGAWDEAPHPPPPAPTKEEIVARLCCDGTFLRFLIEGPPQFPATPAQVVLVKVVFDQVDPADLEGEERELAIQIFGAAFHVPARARRRAVLRLGRESAKSTITAAYAVFRLLTADVSKTFPNTLPTVVFFSSDAETTRTIFEMAAGYLHEIQLARENTEKDNAAAIVFTRPLDGRRVRLRAIVRSAGGVRGRGYPIIDAIVDEAEFTAAAKADAVIKDEHTIDALLPRMVRRAMVILLSTPWEAESYAGTLFDENYGDPKSALAARAPTLLMRNYDPEIVALRAELMGTPDGARLVAREFDCEVVPMGDALVPSPLVDAAVARGVGIERLRQRVSAGIDLGLRRDRSTWLATERHASLLVVVDLEERTPRPGRPLSGTATCAEFAALTKTAGGKHMTGDSHRSENLRDAANDVGAECVILENDAEEIAVYLSSLFREGRIAFAVADATKQARLVRQVKAVRTRAKPGGGLEIIRPRTKELGHCDLESALECAAWSDKRHGPLAEKRAATMKYSRQPWRTRHTT